MEIFFSKLEKQERETAFEIFQKYMKPVIDDAFGWNDEFQRNGFESHLKQEWFSWVLVNDKKSGVVCSCLKENSIHIHLLIIFTEAQRKGIATSVTRLLKTEASDIGKDLTLSCFKNNEPALNLYKKLGFIVKSESEYSYDFICT